MVAIGRLGLPGRLCLPDSARGIVVCIDDSGSSLVDACHATVAAALDDAAIATLRIDLLTTNEHADGIASYVRNDVQLLASRVISATDWLDAASAAGCFSIGYFGTGVGCAVALAAAAERPTAVSAIVACSGRPLLVPAALPQVRAPTLLIILEHDIALAKLNRAGLSQMLCQKCLKIVPAVSTGEGDALKEVGRLARAWFERHLVLPPDA
jgi:putative phosphoribosyl transferase